MSPTLIKLGLAALALVATIAYIVVLQNKVQSRDMVIAAHEERIKLLVEEKVKVEVALEQAGRQVEDLRKQGTKERVRIKTVTIPATCDGALDWLSEEIQK